LAKIEAAQQPVELLFAQYDGFLIVFAWPFETLFLQTFVPEAKTAAIPVEDLKFVAALIAEDKHRSLKH